MTYLYIEDIMLNQMICSEIDKNSQLGCWIKIKNILLFCGNPSDTKIDHPVVGHACDDLASKSAE